MAKRRPSVIKNLTLALPVAMALGSCADRKPPLSPRLFEAAKKQCGATDAYIMKEYPKTIAFHGTSEDHAKQAKCLKERLDKVDVEQIIFVSSAMYGPT